MAGLLTIESPWGHARVIDGGKSKAEGLYNSLRRAVVLALGNLAGALMSLKALNSTDIDTPEPQSPIIVNSARQSATEHPPFMANPTPPP